jgi:DNA-binding response OmpR family regulator
MTTNATILVVEDDFNLRHGIVTELRNARGKYRFDSIEAHDYDGAVGILDQKLPDIALVDIMMGQDDLAGIKIIRYIFEKLNADIPVIVLSARNTSPVILDALKLGASDYLVKPYESEDLLGRVERALDRTRRPRTTGLPVSNQDKLRALMVTAMTKVLLYWEVTTGRNKVRFADDSKLWSIYIDKKGTCSTKTLDKYLNMDTLPNKPKIQKVICSIYFVLNHCKLDSDARQSLENLLRDLQSAPESADIEVETA